MDENLCEDLGLPEDALLLEPREQFDPCLIGVCAFSGRAIYSVEKIVNAIMQEIMSDDPDLNAERAEEMAEEHYSYNIEGSFVGDMTPIYMRARNL